MRAKSFPQKTPKINRLEIVRIASINNTTEEEKTQRLQDSRGEKTPTTTLSNQLHHFMTIFRNFKNQSQRFMTIFGIMYRYKNGEIL